MFNIKGEFEEVCHRLDTIEATLRNHKLKLDNNFSDIRRNTERLDVLDGNGPFGQETAEYILIDSRLRQLEDSIKALEGDEET